MELQELIDRLERYQGVIEEKNVADFLIAGNDAVDTIVRRLQEDGLNEDGMDFDLYTPEYLRKKQKAGRYRGFRDHTLSGDMLRSLKCRLEKTETGYVAVVGVSEAQKEILQGNVDHVGQLIRLSDYELDLIKEDLKSRMQATLQEYLRR